MAEVILVYDPVTGSLKGDRFSPSDTFLLRIGGQGLVSGSFGSGAIASGPIASGQLGGIHFRAGAVQSGHIASGQLGGIDFRANAVLSGHIASGIGPLYTGVQSNFGGGIVIGAESELWSPRSGLLASRYDFGVGSGLAAPRIRFDGTNVTIQKDGFDAGETEVWYLWRHRLGKNIHGLRDRQRPAQIH